MFASQGNGFILMDEMSDFSREKKNFRLFLQSQRLAQLHLEAGLILRVQREIQARVKGSAAAIG